MRHCIAVRQNVNLGNNNGNCTGMGHSHKEQLISHWLDPSWSIVVPCGTLLWKETSTWSTVLSECAAPGGLDHHQSKIVYGLFRSDRFAQTICVSDMWDVMKNKPAGWLPVTWVGEYQRCQSPYPAARCSECHMGSYCNVPLWMTFILYAVLSFFTW